MTTIETDVLVIGGGIAGTLAGIKAAEAGARSVVQVDKGRVGKSGCSAFAAGIMFVFLPGEDNFDDWFQGEVKYGGYLVLQSRIREHLQAIFPLVKDMEKYGGRFLRDRSGKLERQAIRGKYPAMMFPGYQLMDALSKASLRTGVRHVNRVMVTGLLTQGKQVAGAVGFDTRTGDFYVLRARAVVLASGGTMFKGLQPGHRDCTADGYVAAFQAGAVLGGAESNYMMANAFPARFDIGSGMNMFVGLGGRFLNSRGEAFMERYSPTLKDRALLNTLPFCFSCEVREGRGPIYMDMTHFAPEKVQRLRTVLPLAASTFESAGIIRGDRFMAPIEWMITAPNGQAGVVANARFETSLAGLFAVGEAASIRNYTSNLSCAATSGAIAGPYAADFASGTGLLPVDGDQVAGMRQSIFAPLGRKPGVDPDQVILNLQETIVPYNVNLLRREDRLKEALRCVEDIRDNQSPYLHAHDPHYLRLAHEAANLVFAGELYLRSALMRTESRLGVREDYPCMDNINWLKWINARKENGGMKLFLEDVPSAAGEIKAPQEKKLHRLWELAVRLGLARIEKEQVEWRPSSPPLKKGD